MVIYSPTLANTNQSHFIPPAVFQATTPENLFSSQNNPNTTTDPTSAEVSSDAQKANKNEKNEQQGM